MDPRIASNLANLDMIIGNVTALHAKANLTDAALQQSILQAGLFPYLAWQVRSTPTCNPVLWTPLQTFHLSTLPPWHSNSTLPHSHSMPRILWCFGGWLLWDHVVWALQLTSH